MVITRQAIKRALVLFGLTFGVSVIGSLLPGIQNTTTFDLAMSQPLLVSIGFILATTAVEVFCVWILLYFFEKFRGKSVIFWIELISTGIILGIAIVGIAMPDRPYIIKAIDILNGQVFGSVLTLSILILVANIANLAFWSVWTFFLEEIGYRFHLRNQMLYTTALACGSIMTLSFLALVGNEFFGHATFSGDGLFLGFRIAIVSIAGLNLIRIIVTRIRAWRRKREKMKNESDFIL